MKKFFSLLMSLALYTVLVPGSAYALLIDGAENTDPDMLWNTASSDNSGRNNDETDIDCPDGDDAITFTGMRALFMERLKTNNPNLYAEILERMGERKAKLARLCEKHPMLYTRIMERKEKLLERLEKKQDQINEKLCKEFPNAARCDDLPQGKLPNEEAREKFCKEFPGAADCLNRDTEDMTIEDDDPSNDDDDMIDDRDDESNEVEVEGTVTAYSPASPVKNPGDATVTVEGSDLIVSIKSESLIDPEGDITTFAELEKALEAGQTVRVEAEGVKAFSFDLLMADSVKFEIDN